MGIRYYIVIVIIGENLEVKRLINKCKEELNKINKSIEIIELKRINKLLKESGEEKLVKYDISCVWQEYLFYLKGMLYRWNNCFLKLNQIIKEYNKDGMFFGNNPIGDELSYEFENVLISFNKLYEDPLLIEIERHIPNADKKILRSVCPKKNDENGLYWEVNLLRNRAAHGIKGFYTEHDDFAARYMSISSEIRCIEVKEGEIKIITKLLSYRKNIHIREVVRKKIIDAGQKTPLLNLIFESDVPKGKGKKNPQLLFMSNVAYFDLNNEFLELSMDFFKYIETQLELFERNI